MRTLPIVGLALLVAACAAPEASPPDLHVTSLPSPTGAGAAEPNLFTAADGRVVLSWLEPVAGRTHALRLSIRGSDGAWSAPREVTRRDDLFVNWADFPSVVLLPDGRLLAHWLQRNGSATYAYEVRMSESRDEGATWSESVTPHRAGIQAEHGFVSILPEGSGARVFFLDGGAGILAGGHAASGGHGVPMSFSANVWGQGTDESSKTLIDSRVCDCCATASAMTSRGPVAIYRDRSDGTPEIRDIAITRLVDGAWTTPALVHADNWEVNFCPVNGPAIVASGDTVAVAWFTAARDTSKVLVAYSTDAGATFAAPIRVDDGTPAGRVGLQWLDGAAYVSWLERGNADTAFVKLRRVDRGGAAGPALVVSESKGMRSSGFPRLTRSANGFLMAWTLPGSPSEVKVAAIGPQ